jgi:hypothetical protein
MRTKKMLLFVVFITLFSFSSIAITLQNVLDAYIIAYQDGYYHGLADLFDTTSTKNDPYLNIQRLNTSKQAFTEADIKMSAKNGYSDGYEDGYNRVTNKHQVAPKPATPKVSGPIVIHGGTVTTSVRPFIANGRTGGNTNAWMTAPPGVTEED